jgi:hypothetical protein
LQPDEVQRRQLSSRIFDHVQQFYEGWLDETTVIPSIDRARGIKRAFRFWRT